MCEVPAWIVSVWYEMWPGIRGKRGMPYSTLPFLGWVLGQWFYSMGPAFGFWLLCYISWVFQDAPNSRRDMSFSLSWVVWYKSAISFCFRTPLLHLVIFPYCLLSSKILCMATASWKPSVQLAPFFELCVCELAHECECGFPAFWELVRAKIYLLLPLYIPACWEVSGPSVFGPVGGE